MRIIKRYLYTAIFVILVFLMIAFFYYKQNLKQKDNKQINEQSEWFVDKNGYLSYPSNRDPVKFNRQDFDKNESLLVSRIIYQSRNGNIYGFLVTPTSATDLVPGIIFLPGAGVSKESKLELAIQIAELGAAILVIDQRGTGETDGEFPTLDEDFKSFLSKREPYQHLMVYDVLRAFDLLDDSPFVDSNRIIVAGESLGGRIAVMAAAIEKNINGVLVISSAGFDFKDKGDADKDRFINSIDSDHYIGLITPRKIVMIHSINDTIIPISSAANSFSKAEEPKRFILINDTSCKHGYCDAMWGGLVEALDYLIDIRSQTITSVPVE